MKIHATLDRLVRSAAYEAQKIAHASASVRGLRSEGYKRSMAVMYEGQPLAHLVSTGCHLTAFRSKFHEMIYQD